MIDLHVHTKISDGIYSVKDVVERAYTEGIATISICDHDTIAALDEGSKRAMKMGVGFIPGIELSCRWDSGDFHLLGYNIDFQNERLLSALEYFSEKRNSRIDRIIDKLKKLDIHISRDELNLDRESVPGKPHIARVLVKKGVVSSVDEAFRALLGRGKPADHPKEKIEVDDAIELIRQVGGHPVLAHPVTLRLQRSDYNEHIRSLARKGLEGIEVYANLHSDEDVLFFKKLAQDSGLHITGGSDFHGDKSDEVLGRYGKNRVIPADCGDWLV